MQKEFLSPWGKTIYRKLDGRAKASVFYLTGHRNILDHHKGNLIEKICADNAIGMTRFAFYGSDGSVSPSVPENGGGYTSEWLVQALGLFDAVTTGSQILIGYSMGGYLQLALAAARPDRVKGIIGLSAGFGRDLCDQIKANYGTHAIRRTPNGDGFDFTVESDGSIAILQDLDITCPIRLCHARDDALVSHRNMAHIAERVASKDIVTHLAEQGGHRLDDPENEVWLINAIKELAA